MKIKSKAILFDMDRVLIDSLDSWWRSLNVALNAFNYKEITRDEFIEKYWGYDLYDNLEWMGLSKEIEASATLYMVNILAQSKFIHTQKKVRQTKNLPKSYNNKYTKRLLKADSKKI